MFVGELSLDGTAHHVNDILPMATFAHSAGIATLYVPQVNAPGADSAPRRSSASALGGTVYHVSPQGDDAMATDQSLWIQ